MKIGIHGGKRLLQGGVLIVLVGWAAVGMSAVISPGTEECIGCHVGITPNQVAAWEKSQHARMSPQEALGKGGLERKMTGENIPENLLKTPVGCAECHTLNAESHKDSFEHNGYRVHVVVTPSDCAVCHSVEAEQFSQNLMSHARGNLVNNSVYQDLAMATNGLYSFEGGKLRVTPPDALTSAESCDYCHGTAIEVKGTVQKETYLGEMEFPVLAGWPNQGVGRINPDGSKGTCTACHVRHLFPIEMARKPETCSECHKGPDVPAYKVYSVSKHGNMYSALKGKWNFEAVPWTVGKDFQAPTCAACHASLLLNEEGEVVAERTHRMNDRLSWRILGLVYAHPHPASPDTSIIKNKAGLQLPTELTGEPVSKFLIDSQEMKRRRDTMEKVCLSCHSTTWVEGHWARLDNTINTTNKATLAATGLLTQAWRNGIARGLPQKQSIFDEPFERKWTEQWFFFANSTRFSSAMAGADYGVFEYGRWFSAKAIEEMAEWVRTGRPR